MINSETYFTTSGAYIFNTPSLYNVGILEVARAGFVYTEVSGTPSGMQFKNDSLLGLVFDSNIPFNESEKLTVLYET